MGDHGGTDMTGKQAIKARCRDCIGGNGDCVFMDCALKGIAKGKGKVKAVITKASGAGRAGPLPNLDTAYSPFTDNGQNR
jgi:hypothetical protein